MMKNIFILLLVFTAEKCFSQQPYSFNTWAAGNTSYTKTVTAPNNTMTVTYTEGANYRANTLCSGCVCVAGVSTPAIPFYYNQATMYIADYSSGSCYCSGNGGERGLILAGNWPDNAASRWEQIDIVFTLSVCAPVTFSIWDLNQNFWDDGSTKWPYFTDKVDISALDQTGASITAANLNIGACGGNTITTAGNTKSLKGTYNDCGCWTQSISIGASGTWVKQITLKYYPGGCTYDAGCNPWSQYIIVTDILGCNLNTVLPVDLLSFNGKCEGDQKSFEWATASETNNDYFTVEHSRDGTEFFDIGKIAGAGNSSVQNKYTADFPEEDIKYTYYRLKQTDFDGKFSYSSIIHVNCLQNYYDGVSLFPNPAIDEINIHFVTSIDSEVEYEITDVFGRIVKQGATALAGKDLPVKTAELSAGIYFLKLKQAEGSIVFSPLRFVRQ